MLQQDMTLMSVYPQIRAIPDFVKKEQYKKNLVKICDENEDKFRLQKQKAK